jgi:geranylgeranyl diphosphate synthase, type II
MQSFLQLQSLFETHLQQQIFPENPKNLYDACRHILTLEGKRVRPVAVLMANELFAKISADAYFAATAIELFHNFSLIHDDIMDEAPLRRGMPTVHEKWNMPTAILSGDVMNIYAYKCLNNLHKDYANLVINVFNNTAIEVCEGQQMDMDFEKRNDVSIDEYIKMITLKTSVLLAASFKIGALIGGATDGACNLLYEFGKNLGISFQLKDDYLDAFGNSEKTGKQIGGDILSNKKTFLFLKAFENANATQQEKLNNLIANNASSKVADTLNIFEELNIKQETIKAKERYSQLAFENLEKLPMLEARKIELKNLAEFLLNRDF